MKHVKALLICVMALAMMLSMVAQASGSSVVNEPGTIPVLSEPTKITVGISQDSSYLSWQTSAIGDWVKQQTNVEIEWKFYPTSGSDARQQVELEIADSQGKDLPDILLGVINETQRNNFGRDGYLLDLTDYFESMGTFFYEACEREGLDPEDVLKYCKSPDGKLYGVPTLDLALNNAYSNRAWICKDFLEALDMESPTTADELYDFLVAVKENDLNGNGKNDEIGIIGSANGWNGNPLSWLQNMFIYCDNTDDRFMVVDGQLDVSYDKQEYRDFLIYARMLCDEGLLDPLSFTQDYNAAFLPQVTADELQVAIAVCGGVGGFGDNVTHYEAAQVIEGPDGYKAATFTPSSGAIASTAAYITSAAEDPEACFAFLMIGFSDPMYAINARYGQQGLDWDYCTDGEKGLYDALGYPAVFKWLRGDIRTITDQTSVWGGANVTTLPYFGHMAMSYYVDTTVSSNFGAAMTAATTVAQAPYAPEEVVYKIIYTQEEAEATSENRANIRSYIREARTQFVAGDLDPNNDADWENYINTLKSYNYEDVLAIDRAAYARTIEG
ncbi:MAG: extracellular solute-binding protein [Clostridia bacterium]|nr:extracellular solute-binding protein [Clostridia bacterium]